ncbi:MAG: twin arginine-targeting protein translocase TatB [Gallionellales bacterium RIFCSPLOWO2_02_FULL_57_47]|nr:MAG: twin arginine-targeting protein translocase TatB [Gallionellales bacterium RIFCSPLOWO2_02_FULL_57_47]
MFDIAFSELMVIMLVALVVIGPERLPKVARTAGNLWGRMQRYVHSVKNDIANDLAIEEAKQLRGSIGKEIASVEQTMQEARMALEQKILDAQMGKSTDTPDEQKPSVKQSSTTTSTPV